MDSSFWSSEVSQTETVMTDKRTQQEADNSNMSKDPDEWVTGDEPMTGAEASKRIEELQKKTGRGTSQADKS
jgi:hypothetical protein